MIFSLTLFILLFAEKSLLSSKNISLRNAIKYTSDQLVESEEDFAIRIMNVKKIPREPNLK